MSSRGIAISAYSPAFSKGAKVYGANIQSGVVTSAHIADGTVVAGELGAASVTSAKIGTGAVVAGTIGAGAVTSAKIGTAAVTNAKMKAAFLSGTISGLLSGVVAVAHGLGVKPKFVAVGIKATHADIVAGANFFVSHASAATSANIYIKASKTGNRVYWAYVQI